ncbi:hypothetical protein CPAR01_11819 [Colletotrichum paranaense]|uniref:Uncharacterized protein n=1 Tax=Colletotrichum paranaense TaxID=1914294 RepID=A0ABQ9S8I6_9PEZI|nr:uncharacterized protein CPAR01_11819 [Colletotrichum paranaense]KAK1529507.1 hypothetical protein CPAR01_11819 [Colletotrichum paranaense]
MQNLQNLHSATRLIRISCHHWVVRLVTWHSSPAKRVSGGSVPTERGFRLQFMSLCHSQIPLHPFASVACSRSWGIADLWVLHGRQSTSIAMSPERARAMMKSPGVFARFQDWNQRRAHLWPLFPLQS